jgi:2-phospho-L-lactate guanylyltransferase
VWSVVVPVKRLRLAKTRLAGALAGVDHQQLVLALATDTVSAALGCAEVGRVVVVTDDPVAVRAVTAAGAVVVGDEPDAGLNPALEHGAGHARRLAPDHGVGVLSSDLPALRPAELAAALAAASAYDRAFVADAAGTGTTLLAARAGVALGPHYGTGSRAAHAASGARELTGGWPSLRRDVDTAADLADAVGLGVGAATAALLREAAG